MLKSMHLCLAFTAAVSGVCSAVADEQAAIPLQRPNVLVLVTDDQRPDTISALGNAHIQTPHLDALARRGVSFTRAVSPNPICTPSRAEILSGCCGFHNGVTGFGGKIHSDLVLWPEAMRSAGYRTWYVGKWHNDGRPLQRGYVATRGLYCGGGGKWMKEQVDWKGSRVTGYRGWIFQDDEGNLFPERGVGLTPNISSDFADAAIELLGREMEEPFFLHVNFTAPHDPLLLPPGYDGRYTAEQVPLPENFLPEHPFDHGNLKGRDELLLPWPRTPAMVRDVIAMYYAVISHMDEQVGRIIAALRQTGKLDNTIIFFTSDHGLAVGSHGLRGKQNMYEHTVGVPLIVVGPGIPRGQRRDAQVYLRDLYPTACDLAGVPIPDTVRGRSFARVIAGEARQVHPYVFCYFRESQRMIRTDRWKLIHYPQAKRWQLFDLQEDPFELTNLVDDAMHAQVLANLQEKLKQAQREHGDPLAES
jgi:arylsulfatase A-like enzyme